jgi:hypothetical protein
MDAWTETQLRAAFEQALELLRLRDDDVACIQKEEGGVTIAIGEAASEITGRVHSWMDQQDRKRAAKRAGGKH